MFSSEIWYAKTYKTKIKMNSDPLRPEVGLIFFQNLGQGGGRFCIFACIQTSPLVVSWSAVIGEEIFHNYRCLLVWSKKCSNKLWYRVIPFKQTSCTAELLVILDISGLVCAYLSVCTLVYIPMFERRWVWVYDRACKGVCVYMCVLRDLLQDYNFLKGFI